MTDSEELENAILELKFKLVQRIGVRTGTTVVDMGCGQGGFTVSLARALGENGKVLAVDVSDEYLAEFTDRLNKHGVKDRVTFFKANAVNLASVLSDGIADVVASYRLLEELIQPEAMPEIVKEMARIVRKDGKVGIVELCTKPKNKAEETYIRLHKESGDCLFEQSEIIDAMEAAQLVNVNVEKVGTDIWISPDLAKRDLSHAQVWYDASVEKSLGKLINKYGMKYPALLLFSGTKT
jgi:ubiquinone/menaquinone biosynthesis C-methylase UbiE